MIEIINLNKWIKVELKEFLYMLWLFLSLLLDVVEDELGWFGEFLCVLGCVQVLCCVCGGVVNVINVIVNFNIVVTVNAINQPQLIPTH